MVARVVQPPGLPTYVASLCMPQGVVLLPLYLTSVGQRAKGGCGVRQHHVAGLMRWLWPTPALHFEFIGRCLAAGAVVLPQGI